MEQWIKHSQQIKLLVTLKKHPVQYHTEDFRGMGEYVLRFTTGIGCQSRGDKLSFHQATGTRLENGSRAKSVVVGKILIKIKSVAGLIFH